MMKVLLIFVGGGIGSLLRYWLAGLMQAQVRLKDAPVFPIGTLTVNIVGSLAIGVLAALFTGHVPLRLELRMALFIGLLGGFTTFSTFSFETMQLADEGFWGRAALNVLITNILCLAAVWVGYRATQHIAGIA